MEKIIEISQNLPYSYNTYDYLTSLQHQIAICPENRIILDFQKINFMERKGGKRDNYQY